MRLGQLARKLVLRPSQLVDFLSLQQIHFDEGSNARLEDEHVIEIVKHFAPDRLQEIVAGLTLEEEIAPAAKSVEPVQTQPEQPQPEKTEVALPEGRPQPGKPEVIKAPKVELSGLKVLGKIELPEPKKKEVATENSTGESTAPAVEERKSRPAKRESKSRKEFTPQQQPWRNPIAQQREQEAREAEEKKKAAAEREKERRKDNYLKKVKVSQPVKAVKLYQEHAEAPIAKSKKPAPKTLWGKFVNWLNT